MQRFAALIGMWLIVACAASPESSATPPPGIPPDSSPTATSGPRPAPTVPLTDGCPEGDVMLTDGSLVRWDRPGADGARVAGIGWRMVGQCHVITISFATDDGAPATTPPTLTARILRSAGILRIDSEATSSVIVDQLVEEGLVERIFVPVDADGNRFIDMVVTGPVIGRARLLTSPARLEIELQPGGPVDVGSPLVTDEIVLVEPALGATVEPILDITGYSSGLAEALSLSVLLSGNPTEETTVELESQPGQWTAFAFTFPVGDGLYDSLQVATPDGSVLAGIPFSR